MFDRPAADVQTIAINGLAGNDNNSVDATLAERVIINGGTGADTIQARGGNDILIGGSGNDSLQSGTGNDRILGLAGNDFLNGEGGNDTLVGDGPTAFGNDTMRGDNGVDLVDYGQYLIPVHVSLDGVDNDGNPGGEVDSIWSNVENLAGGGGADSLTGSSANNALIGNGGNDTITGNDGDDSMFGGGGNDRFRAEDGVVDAIEGGAGTDLFLTLSGSDFNVDRVSEGDLVNDLITAMEN